MKNVVPGVSRQATVAATTAKKRKVEKPPKQPAKTNDASVASVEQPVAKVEEPVAKAEEPGEDTPDARAAVERERVRDVPSSSPNETKSEAAIEIDEEIPRVARENATKGKRPIGDRGHRGDDTRGERGGLSSEFVTRMYGKYVI